MLLMWWNPKWSSYRCSFLRKIRVTWCFEYQKIRCFCANKFFDLLNLALALINPFTSVTGFFFFEMSLFFFYTIFFCWTPLKIFFVACCFSLAVILNDLCFSLCIVINTQAIVFWSRLKILKLCQVGKGSLQV